MKKRTVQLVGVMMTIILVLSLGLPVTAQEKGKSIDILLEEKEAERLEHLPQLTQIIEDLQESMDGLDSCELENAYRVTFLSPDLLEVLESSGRVIDALESTVQWVVPYVSADGVHGVFTFLETDEEITYIGSSTGDIFASLIIRNDDIRKGVCDSGLDGKLTNMQIVVSNRHYTTFVCLTAGEEEYLIPYSHHAEDLGISNGKVYSAAEIFEKLSVYFKEDAPQNPKQEDQAPADEENFFKKPIMMIAIDVVLMAAGLALAYLVRKKREE